MKTRPFVDQNSHMKTVSETLQEILSENYELVWELFPDIDDEQIHWWTVGSA